MSYLLDKKEKKKKFYRIAFAIFFLIVFFYFRLSIWSGFSYVSEKLFHPIFVVGNNFEGGLKNIGSYFVSKKSLYIQNQNLEAEVKADDARMSNYNSFVSDDASLKQVLNRKDSKTAMTVAAILAKPNQNPYDTLLIDAGTKNGVKVGNTVFALGDVPIGRVSDIYPNSAKVILFSNASEKTEAVVFGKVASDGTNQGGGVFMELVGRGGGNFEMDLPKGLILQTGDQVVLPGIHPYVLAIAEKVVSDPRSPSNKELLISPVNIQQLKFVEIEQ